MKLDPARLRPICLNSSIVDEYSNQRRLRYGIEAVLPVEFFPRYQSLRPRDSSRFFYEIDSVCFVLKKVRLFQAQYNRMEGLPVSFYGDRDKEMEVLDRIIRCPWVDKVRCSSNEAEVLHSRGIETKEEGTVANFWIDVEEKIRRMERSSWRPRAVLNQVKDELEWRPSEWKDCVDLRSMLCSWMERKGKDVMFKDLYASIMAAAGTQMPDLVKCVLLHQGKIVAFVVYVLSGGCAHLLMNLSSVMASSGEEEVSKVEYYAGKLSHYFMMKSLLERGVKNAFLGFGDNPNDPLNTYKRELATGEFRLMVADIPAHGSDLMVGVKENGFLI